MTAVAETKVRTDEPRPIPTGNCYWEFLGPHANSQKHLIVHLPEWVTSHTMLYDYPKMLRLVQSSTVEGMGLKVGDEVTFFSHGKDWALQRVMVKGAAADRVTLNKSPRIDLAVPADSWQNEHVIIAYDGDLGMYGTRNRKSGDRLPYHGQTLEAAKMDYLRSLPKRLVA